MAVRYSTRTPIQFGCLAVLMSFLLRFFRFALNVIQYQRTNCSSMNHFLTCDELYKDQFQLLYHFYFDFNNDHFNCNYFYYEYNYGLFYLRGCQFRHICIITSALFTLLFLCDLLYGYYFQDHLCTNNCQLITSNVGRAS